jgi:hypothetical protein
MDAGEAASFLPSGLLCMGSVPLTGSQALFGAYCATCVTLLLPNGPLHL